MRSLLLLLVVVGCRDKVDRDELNKATALANSPAPAQGCPAGSEPRGAPRPRGPGEWCQRVDGGRLLVYRLDGALWAEGAITEATGMEGEWKFYAPDGKVALVRTFEKNSTKADDMKIEGVELPPTMLPVCVRDFNGDKPATTTKCPPE